MNRPIELPNDTQEAFPGVPLKGHICALKRGDKKHYWRVEGLIEKSASLPVVEANVADLIVTIGNGTWFGKGERVTIQLVLNHIDRALKAELSFPVILSADGKVMDGSHRILSAYIKGVEKLKMVQFQTDPTPDYVSEVD